MAIHPLFDNMSYTISIEYLTEIINNNSDWLWEVDQDGRYTYVSEVIYDLLGFTKEEILGRTPFDFMPPDEAKHITSVFEKIIKNKQPFSGLINRNLHKNKKVIVLESSGIPLLDQEGNLKGYRGIDRDVSALGERVLQLQSIYDHTPVALASVDRHGKMIMANQAMYALLHIPMTIHDFNFATVFPDIWISLSADFECADQDLPLIPRDVQVDDRIYLFMPFKIANLEHNTVGLSLALVDVTERREIEEKLKQANQQLEIYAQRDYLTGTYNRRYTDQILYDGLLSALNTEQDLSICLLDIDFFKNYNDSLGHLAGDVCLKKIADILLQAVDGTHAMVSRWGGEEFLIVCPNTSTQSAFQLVQKIQNDIVRKHIEHTSSPLGLVTISAGISTTSLFALQQRELDMHIYAQDLMRQADQALYRAKNNGRNQIEHF